MGEITQALEIAGKLGFPIWAAVVLWATVKITHAVSAGIEDLRQRDTSLQKAIEAHVAQSDTRVSLIEQLLQRHDRSIDQLWDKWK